MMIIFLVNSQFYSQNIVSLFSLIYDFILKVSKCFVILIVALTLPGWRICELWLA